MKNLIVGFVLVLATAGCTTPDDSLPVLYQAFSRYERVANSGNIHAVAGDFFSAALLGRDYQTNPAAAGQLLFKRHMTSTQSHHEKMDGKDGCLTINGYGEAHAPVVFSLKYVAQHDRWLIDKIHVLFVESESGFSDVAKCPDEYPG